MRFVEQSAELWRQEDGYEGMLRHIERCGRVAYKSKMSDNIEGTKKFVKNLIDKGHTSVLEHGARYITLPIEKETYELFSYCSNNKYSYVSPVKDDDLFSTITTNYRVIQESPILWDMNYFTQPSEFHKKRYTMHLVTSIGIVRELLRHRKFSFTNESTRFCNYNKERLGGEITFVIPEYISTDHRIKNTLEDPQHMLYELQQIGNDSDRLLSFLDVCSTSERRYLNTIRLNSCTPQQAREFLPMCTKSEIVMTGFEDDWKHFFDLRLYGKTGKPHPDMVVLAQKIKDEFEKNNIKF